jgi:hypothetical protein
MPKIRGAPSDLEKRRFLKDAFEVIRREFDGRLHQLVRDNAGVEFDLTPLDATKFTAEIFVNERSRAQCKIWQGGMFSGEGISYTEGSSMLSDNACNEVLTLAAGNGELRAGPDRLNRIPRRLSGLLPGLVLCNLARGA